MLLQLAEVSFGYPGSELFSKLTWQINPGSRIGLVGPNGVGKSTLLRLMTGQLTVDSGQVAKARGLTLGYLRQSQELVHEMTLLEALMEPFAELERMHEELRHLEQKIATAATEQDLARYGELQDLYRQKGGYSVESQVKALSAELGFGDADLSRSVHSLSGGERGRLELGRTLLAQPDLLLLDEPTNHLDTVATENLEARLREWPTAFVLVSHDRYFLRAVCNEIVELEAGRAISYPGSYDKYLSERTARHERLNAAYEKQQDQIEKTEDFIRRNLAGQKTKQAQGRRKQLERVERLDRPTDELQHASQIKLRFSIGDHAGGKESVVTRRLTAGYADVPLVKDLDLTLYRGDRVGIIGENGAGKSTLLKTLVGRLPPLGGEYALGHMVKLGYFDQKLSDLDENRSLLEEIRSVRGDFNEDVGRAFLGRFRFSGDDAFRKVKGLSGGERNRLSLAKMMLEPRNLLALDEPTNHLDIVAREVLEEALAGYEGTLIVVSHDRYFLDRLCTKILYIANGHAQLELGNYTDFRDRQRAAKDAAKRPPPVEKKPIQPSVAAPPPPEDRRAGQRELEKKSAASPKSKNRSRRPKPIWRASRRSSPTIMAAIGNACTSSSTKKRAAKVASGSSWATGKSSRPRSPNRLRRRC